MLVIKGIKPLAGWGADVVIRRHSLARASCSPWSAGGAGGVHGLELSKWGRPLPRGPERKQRLGMVFWIHDPRKCMVVRMVEGLGGAQWQPSIKGLQKRSGNPVHTYIALHLHNTLHSALALYLKPLLGLGSFSSSPTLHVLKHQPAPLGTLLNTQAPQPPSCLSSIPRVRIPQPGYRLTYPRMHPLSAGTPPTV